MTAENIGQKDLTMTFFDRSETWSKFYLEKLVTEGYKPWNIVDWQEPIGSNMPFVRIALNDEFNSYLVELKRGVRLCHTGRVDTIHITEKGRMTYAAEFVLSQLEGLDIPVVIIPEDLSQGLCLSNYAEAMK